MGDRKKFQWETGFLYSIQPGTGRNSSGSTGRLGLDNCLYGIQEEIPVGCWLFIQWEAGAECLTCRLYGILETFYWEAGLGWLFIWHTGNNFNA